MFAIYNYRVEMDLETESMYVQLPKHAKVLSLLLKDINEAYIYAIVDLKDIEEEVRREVLWLGTGWQLSEEQKNRMNYYTFLGTYKLNNLVWHFWIEPDENFDF